MALKSRLPHNKTQFQEQLREGKADFFIGIIDEGNSKSFWVNIGLAPPGHNSAGRFRTDMADSEAHSRSLLSRWRSHTEKFEKSEKKLQNVEKLNGAHSNHKKLAKCQSGLHQGQQQVALV